MKILKFTRGFTSVRSRLCRPKGGA